MGRYFSLFVNTISCNFNQNVDLCYRKVVKTCDNMLNRKDNLDNDDIKRRLHEQKLKLELYESIIKLNDERWSKWQDIDKEATNDGRALVDKLLSINQYGLALNVKRFNNLILLTI